MMVTNFSLSAPQYGQVKLLQCNRHGDIVLTKTCDMILVWWNWLDWTHRLCHRSDMRRCVPSVLQSVPGVEVDDQLCIRTRNSSVRSMCR